MATEVSKDGTLTRQKMTFEELLKAKINLSGRSGQPWSDKESHERWHKSESTGHRQLWLKYQNYRACTAEQIVERLALGAHLPIADSDAGWLVLAPDGTLTMVHEASTLLGSGTLSGDDEVKQLLTDVADGKYSKDEFTDLFAKCMRVALGQTPDETKLQLTSSAESEVRP